MNELTRFGLETEQWEAAEVEAQKLYANIFEPLTKATKKFTDELHSQIYETLQATLESDTAYNVRDMIQHRSNEIINALLNGGWREERYKEWLGQYDLEEYRKAIYLRHRDIIQNQLIDDLNKEVERLNRSLEFYR